MKRPLLNFILCLLSQASFAQNLDEVLCGVKPQAHEEVVAEQVARELERQMPPVQFQANTGWCSAFSATDLVNFHNFSYSKQSASAFYGNKTLLSPIDGMGAAAEFITKHATYRVQKPGMLDINSGVLITEVLNGWQFMKYQGRSSAQLPFDPQYKSDYDLSEKQNMKSINTWLYELAKYNKLLGADGNSLYHYQSLAKLKGAADVAIVPYVIHEYFGNDKLKFLSTMRNILYPEQGLGRPVSLALCSQVIDMRANPKAPCEVGHAVTLVGAFYKGGKCHVRLRNSWGRNWRDKGHISLPINQFLQIFEQATLQRFEHGYTHDVARKYYAVWLGPEDPSQTEGRTRVIGDSRVFLGQLKFHFYPDRSFVVDQYNGFTKDFSGKLLEAFRLPFGNGLVYSGFITDLGAGQWRPSSGRVYRDNHITYVYHQKVETDRYYTGEVEEKPNFAWTGTKGFETNAQGEMLYVYNYPDSEGIVRTGPVQDLGEGKFKPKD